MKIDKNSLTYANEHPKGKKPTEETVKVAKSSASTLENYSKAVSYTHLRAHETSQDLVCRLLLEKKKISCFPKRCSVIFICIDM